MRRSACLSQCNGRPKPGARLAASPSANSPTRFSTLAPDIEADARGRRAGAGLPRPAAPMGGLFAELVKGNGGVARPARAVRPVRGASVALRFTAKASARSRPRAAAEQKKKLRERQSKIGRRGQHRSFEVLNGDGWKQL